MTSFKISPLIGREEARDANILRWRASWFTWKGSICDFKSIFWSRHRWEFKKLSHWMRSWAYEYEWGQQFRCCCCCSCCCCCFRSDGHVVKFFAENYSHRKHCCSCCCWCCCFYAAQHLYCPITPMSWLFHSPILPSVHPNAQWSLHSFIPFDPSIHPSIHPSINPKETEILWIFTDYCWKCQ